MHNIIQVLVPCGDCDSCGFVNEGPHTDADRPCARCSERGYQLRDYSDHEIHVAHCGECGAEQAVTVDFTDSSDDENYGEFKDESTQLCLTCGVSDDYQRACLCDYGGDYGVDAKCAVARSQLRADRVVRDALRDARSIARQLGAVSK